MTPRASGSSRPRTVARTASSTTPPSRRTASAPSPRGTRSSSTWSRAPRAPRPRTSPRRNPAGPRTTDGPLPPGERAVSRGRGAGASPRVPALLVPVGHPATGQVVGREDHGHPVSLQHPDLELAHLARRVGEDLVPVVEEDPVVPVGEDFRHHPLHLDAFFLRHPR